MRILHITPDYYPAMGGAELHIKEFSERLLARGHTVSVLAMNSRCLPIQGSERSTSSEVINGVHVHRLNNAYALHNRLFNIRGAHRVMRTLLTAEAMEVFSTSPFSLRALLFTLRAGADVVAVMNWYHGSLAAQACVARSMSNFALVGIPLLHIERDWANYGLIMRMLSRCDAVATNTAFEKEFIEQRSSQRNVHVTGAGVEPADFADADGATIRRRHQLADAPVVGYVGRMQASKGTVDVIEAMRVVWRHRPDARLLLAGSPLPPDPRCDVEVGAALSQLSDSERSNVVCLGGFKDSDKPSIFAALDIFAMPSVAESFGIAYLEAWLCGTAVIGASIGSTSCVIDDGVNGLLVPPRDPDRLAKAILRLLGDPDLRQRMGAAGRAKTLSDFTWDKSTDRIERVYTMAHDTLLASRGRARQGA